MRLPWTKPKVEVIEKIPIIEITPEIEAIPIYTKKNFYSQAHQDMFVMKVLKHKKNGIFVEIGSCDYIIDNNTYLLEKIHNWSGIMVEYDPKHLDGYKLHRKNAHHIIQDATTINFLDEFERLSFPKHIDYLQVDLDVENRSTLTTLENLDSQVMRDYKFAVVTFEHDIYTGDYFNTRQASRDIFEKNGYFRVFSDVMEGHQVFEDWYVHPELVDMTYINEITTDKSLSSSDIVYKVMH